MTEENWEKIGEVAIDSGTIALVDACHLRNGAGEADQLEGSWETWCALPLGETMVVRSHAGVDIATFVTTTGDAMLEVYARRNAKGLIEEIRVKFPWAEAAAGGD